MTVKLQHLLALTMACVLVHPVNAQNASFEKSHSYAGAGLGLFTYHGPIDLLGPDTGSNFTRETEPAVAVFGSFPLLQEYISFRFQLLVANFNTSDGQQQVGSGENEFLTKRLLLFEPEIVVSLPPIRYGDVVPYVFGGFGGTLADFHGSERNVVNFPGSGIPGPERSVFHIPFGAGLDIPVSEKYRFYVEASWRMDFNYVVENDPNFNSHSTSLLMAGLKMCLDCESDDPIPLSIPGDFDGDYVPDTDSLDFNGDKECDLVELDAIEFDERSAELTPTAINSLDQNIEALILRDSCCIRITGYAAGENVQAKLLAEKRTRVVREYLVSGGILESKISHRAFWISDPCSEKNDRGDPPCNQQNTTELETCSCLEPDN